jgi:L-lactate dehydrogenase (cytochrome)
MSNYAVAAEPRTPKDLISWAANLDEFERRAQRFLPPALFHYVAGASEDALSYKRNCNALRERVFLPKVMVDVSERTTKTSLFGTEYAAPFGIAPMGFSRLIAADGDVTLARAAASESIPFVLSGASLTRMEDVRAAGGSSWFQAYIAGDKDRIAALIDRVAAAGFRTLVITADTPVNGAHERAARHGFVAPVRKGDFNLAWQGLTHPSWLWKVVLRNGLAGLRFRFENVDAVPGPPMFSSTLVRDMKRRDALTWKHLEAIRKLWTGNLIVKGIMDPDDAKTCESIGADGIVVSNHGGRQADCAASSLDALERIAHQGLKIKLLYDGGIRRGSHVLMALKLGACFVLVGRPMLFAAAAGGVEGVRHAIRLLASEVSANQALLGIRRVEDVRQIAMFNAALTNSLNENEAQV